MSIINISKNRLTALTECTDTVADLKKKKCKDTVQHLPHPLIIKIFF